MSSTHVDFEGSEGTRLDGRLEMPIDGRPVAYALFAHCFTCSKDLKAVVRISRALCARGIAVLRFDFTGLGRSEGDFADTNFSSNVDDLRAAAGWLAHEREAPRLLVGHSLGGAAVLHAARELDAVRAVATIAAPSDPAHVERLIRSSREEIEREGEAEVEIAGRAFRIRKQFLDDLAEACSAESLGALGAALLICHSPVDRIVGIENAERIYRAARHPKSFLSLDRADHLLTDEEDAVYVGEVLAAWARRYVTATGERGGEIPAEGEVFVRTPAEGFRTEIRAGRHALVADEPERVGGTDAGPTPYDLLLASLGACTSMTLGMYARRKEWPLEEAAVRLRHRREHAADCEGCERSDARVDVIDRTLELLGSLDDTQRERLAEIAARCPVHRTLEGELRIETRLRDGEG